MLGAYALEALVLGADSFDHLYEYADKALYFSKVKGRDCYTFYSDISKSDI
ncbi:MAG: hypothetical protein ACOCM0_05185 [Campylobacter hyointestinalis]